MKKALKIILEFYVILLIVLILCILVGVMVIFPLCLPIVIAMFTNNNLWLFLYIIDLPLGGWLMYICFNIIEKVFDKYMDYNREQQW